MHSLKHWFRAWLTSLLFAALALLQACGGSDETPVAYELIPAQVVSDPLNAVDPTAVPTADDKRSYFHVFRTLSEWSTWWARVRSRYSQQALPEVDFSTSTVAGVYLGMRPNGCYALSIQQVVERGGAIIVRYRENKPDPGDGCTAAVVYPLKLIRIQATGLPIEFEQV